MPATGRQPEGPTDREWRNIATPQGARPNDDTNPYFCPTTSDEQNYDYA